jgi:hydrogenase maturation protease
MKKDTVVLGLGNPLMSDEGVGCCIVQRFLENTGAYPQVDFIYAGTVGISILHLIEGRRKAILVDSALMGTEPGTIRKFTPQQVESVKKLSHQSLHETDILEVLELAKRLGQCPATVVIFGIEPQTVEPGLQLSKTLTGRMDEYIRAIAMELGGSKEAI